ncbi:hypothetical protein DNFV4_02183 [Nitrospira tepida]|uniref:DUF4403 family protein n=1 Tax=Nitrospira tepida TaxID=2973512 RepID=A0AA86MZ80_9BACT|nr:DUF4403 family protein [Nitrospira tepida]CAI4031764.1 hypothetical protein DNFV4_02183 [Nitrospira tepida]
MRTTRFLPFVFALLLWTAGVHAKQPGPASSDSQQTGPSAIMVHAAAPLALLKPALDELDAAWRQRTGDRWTALAQGAGFIKYAWKRERAEWTVRGNHVDFSLTITFTADTATSPESKTVASCGRRAAGRAPGRVVARITSVLSLGPQYNVQASSKVTSVQAVGACLRELDRADLTPTVAYLLRADLQQALPILNTHIQRQFQFKEPVQRAWTSLQRPVAVDERQHQTLLLDPRETRAGSIEGQDSLLKAAIGFMVLPRLTNGQVATSTAVPLPLLKTTPPPDGFHVSLDVPLPYEEANQQLAQRLVGQTYGTEPGTITIRQVHFHPAGDKAALEMTLDLAGLAPITLLMQGEPRYEPETQTVRFTHFDYQIKNRSMLTDFAESLLHEEFRRWLEQSATLPLADKLEEARQQLEAGLNRDVDGGRLQGRISILRLVSLTMKPTLVLGRFIAEGELHYHVRSRQFLR